MVGLSSRFALLCASFVSADIYMHTPPGGNNRNRERNNNRQNANRLFDSQNNGQGGYPWRGKPSGEGVPDPITYYTGSEMEVAWTAQHACGANKNIHCELVIQYACDAGANDPQTSMLGLRDGYPTGFCFDSKNDNRNPASCESTTCGGCTSTTSWLSRVFQSASQNNRKVEGTNTIPDPLQTGAGNLGSKTAAQRKTFYDAATIGAKASRNNGDDYGVEFGMHENNRWYEKCAFTQRNKGLFVADQKLKKTDARATRQNPNGNRRGLECPEERDYWPYWRPTPWRDLAVLTSDITYCDYFQSHSQNVKETYECACTFLDADNIAQAAQASTAEDKKCPISQEKCEDAGYVWTKVAAQTGTPPTCQYHPFNRDNHLGNSMPVDPQTGEPVTPGPDSQPEAATFKMVIPPEMKGKCVLRMRYNMSTNDYPSHEYAKNGGTVGVGLTSLKNCPWTTSDNDCGAGTSDGGDPDCFVTGTGVDADFACGTSLTEKAVPLYNRPYVNLFNESSSNGFTLGLAINTHQTGRTFEDRSYVFNVATAPVSGRIVNLGIRGRRGNIVQSCPAVEYDFTPTLLRVAEGDYVHIQLHGSDFNDNRNANNGEGWEFSDRTNIVQSHERGTNYPRLHTDIDMFPDKATAKKWAWVGQDPQACDPNVNNDKNQNTYKNCGKLNMAPNRFPQDPADGLIQMNMAKGTYTYYSTRNNNFSNRSHKAQIVVGDKNESKEESMSTGAQLAIGFSSAFAVGLVVSGVSLYMKKNKKGCFAKGGKFASRGSKFASRKFSSTATSV